MQWPAGMFNRTVNVRTPEFFKDGVSTAVTLDTQEKAEQLVDQVRAAKKDRNNRIGSSKLYLLPRYNPARADGSSLRDGPLPAHTSLATLMLQDGDTVDFCANPELYACLTIAAYELRFGDMHWQNHCLHGECSRCGGPTEEQFKSGLSSWLYCADRECDFPALKPKHSWCKDKVHINTFALAKFVGDCDHFEQEQLKSLPGSALRTAADVDTLFDAARPHLQAFNQRRKNGEDPAVLHLVRKYLGELQQLIAAGQPDPLGTLIKRHQPAESMPAAAKA